MSAFLFDSLFWGGALGCSRMPPKRFSPLRTQQKRLGCVSVNEESPDRRNLFCCFLLSHACSVTASLLQIDVSGLGALSLFCVPYRLFLIFFIHLTTKLFFLSQFVLLRWYRRLVSSAFPLFLFGSGTDLSAHLAGAANANAAIIQA